MQKQVRGCKYQDNQSNLHVTGWEISGEMGSISASVRQWHTSAHTAGVRMRGSAHPKGSAYLPEQAKAEKECDYKE